MKARDFKTVFSVLWAVLALGAFVAWERSDLELAQVPELLEAWLSRFGLWRAAAIYIVLYTVRPLILFPATLLTVASGLVFGPWLGILFTIVGENASANFAFVLARWLGRNRIDDLEIGRLKAWDDKIRDNALMSVLMMRLLLLPFDGVNYGCGLTSMRQRDFFLGTLFGIMPALITFVLLGGAGASGVENRGLMLGAAVFFLALGLVVARVLRRESPEEQTEG
ncbi:MAG: TVP38/TMEM64 family protein [Myxococcota bacterium]|jgi:uncharacterized membrane protein YdjX (TVP38/TMEM64 family)|nr:TVP38/TMEM64 family protein [Myxococcota bacterium]